MANHFDYSSTTVPETALFVAADEPLLVFPSAAAAALKLEAIDVNDGVFTAAYGPRGEPYSIRAVEDQVVIERTGESERPDELKALLLRYLQAGGRETEATASVEALVAEVWKIESGKEHDPFGERFATRMPLWGCMALIVALGMALFLLLR